MAGRKRTTSRAVSTSSRQTRSSSSRNAIPEPYRQLLAEAGVTSNVETSEPPRKRRRPGERSTATQPPKASLEQGDNAHDNDEEEDETEDIQFEDVAIPVPTVQTLCRDSDDEDDEEEDGLQFEDVDFSFPDLKTDTAEDGAKEIQLDLSARANSTTGRHTDRRKPINKSEKQRRVEIHKTHLLCLLSHVSRRNRWCNDSVVQETLRKLLTPKMISYLNPGSNLSQFGQTESLKNGLDQAGKMFKLNYEVVDRGLRRALWADNEEHLQNYHLPEDSESPMEKSDFRDAAKSLRGSRDVGAQLYCALLRAAGVEARLVCSLQPLSFVSGGPSMAKPPESKQKLSIEEQYARRPTYDSTCDGPVSASPTARRRLGHLNATAFEIPTTVTPPSSSRKIQTPKKIRESPYPVYWVEVLDVAHQKWQPADPLVTESFWRPRVFEPPASDRENCMVYVIGFEADGTAIDVTRRYTKAYNAKTRRMRVESVITNGEKWWRKSLRAYSRGYITDLDQIENNELAAAEAREPMPRNLVDFKDHPIYALERHLRRHEALTHGATPSGTAGAGSKGPLEKVYRRRDVRLARTREKWYRLGREVPADEIPVKFLPKPAKKQTDVFGDEDNNDGTDMAGTPIFTMEQTKLYKAPPIVDGVIPKNRYGNLDVFVPSMVPQGGAYVADEYGAQAAFTLGIDYAPALTGFQFKGRQGTAVLHGVVVASEHEEAVRAVIDGLKDKEADIELERRRREVLRTWKTFLMNLRVRQRIWAGVNSDEEGANHEQNSDLNQDAEKHDSEGPPAESPDSEDGEGGFVIDDDDFGGGFC